jgi:hypothetical protein
MSTAIQLLPCCSTSMLPCRSKAHKLLYKLIDELSSARPVRALFAQRPFKELMV